MPNKIIITANKANTTKDIEYFHPITQTYQSSNQLLNIPAGTYNQHKVRLVGSSPEIIDVNTTSVVVSDPVQTPPTITSFTPMIGAPSSTFVITGTNFVGVSDVKINNVSVGSYTVNSTTQITVTLSSTNTTGLLKVVTPAGTATSTLDFTVQVEAPFNAPTNFVVAAQTNGTLKSTWDTLTNAVDYDLQRATNSAFTQGIVNIKNHVVATDFTDAKVSPLTVYYYRVRGRKANGAVSNWSTVASDTAPAITGPTLSSFGILDDSTLAMQSTGFGADQTDAIQAVLDMNLPILIWDVRVTLYKTLRYSSTRISAINGGGVIMADNSNCPAFLNAHPVGWALDGNGDYIEGTLGTIIDHDIILENMIINMNGFRYVNGVMTAMQQHDILPDNAHPELYAGWVVGFRFAGVRNITLRNNVLRNQRTFCGFTSHFDGALDDNNLVEALGDTANTDGLKWLVGKDLELLSVSGYTGDDMRSFMASDIFFPYIATLYPGGQVGFDRWAVYGTIDNVNCGIVDLQSSNFGVRLGSITDATRVKNVTIDEISGASNNQGFLDDNYEQKKDFYGPGPLTGTRTGGTENIHIKRFTSEMLGGTYAHSPGNIFLNTVAFGTYDIDYIEQNTFQYNQFGKITFATDASIPVLNIGEFKSTPNTDVNTPLIRGTGGYIGTLNINKLTLDRSALGGASSTPVVETTSTSRIDLLSIGNPDTQSTALNTYAIIGLPSGSIGEVRLTNINTSNCRGVYVPNGTVIDKLVVNDCDTLISAYFGGGSVTTLEGNYFYIHQLATYQETSPFVVQSGAWTYSASSYNSNGACLVSTGSSSDIITIKFRFNVPVSFRLKSNNASDWGILGVTVDGGTQVQVDQSTQPNQIRTTYTSPQYTANTLHTIVAKPLVSGKTTVWDDIEFFT